MTDLEAARTEAHRRWPAPDPQTGADLSTVDAARRQGFVAGWEAALASREATPPAYLALDLWMALGLHPRGFDGYYERNGWATTWAVLLDAVRTMLLCDERIDADENCVLRAGHIGPHMGASDVGSSEPLPSREATPEPGNDHVMIVRQERQGLVYKPECHAPEGAPCRVTERHDLFGSLVSTKDEGTCHLVDWLNDDPGLIQEMNSEEFEIARIAFRWHGDFEDGGWARAGLVTPVTDDYEAGYAEGFHHGSSTPAPVTVTDDMAWAAAHALARARKEQAGTPQMVNVNHARAALEAALNP